MKIFKIGTYKYKKSNHSMKKHICKMTPMCKNLQL